MTPHPYLPVLGRDDVYVVITHDGSETLFSRQFNATYHSVHGAVSESRHVFIQHGLKTQAYRQAINVLEFGFGSGLNAFLAFLFSKKYSVPLSYTGIEDYRISREVASQLHYHEYLLASQHHDLFLKMHTGSAFSEDAFDFRCITSADFQQLSTSPSFDCIFFDAFAPGAQPELWQDDVFEKLFHLTTVGGTLATYCAQGEVRRKLQRAGYQVNRLPGPPGKREMIQAIRIE